MEIVGIIILGLIAGFLARALLPGSQPMGIILTCVLGIVGSLVGFYLFTELLGIGDSDKFDLGGIVGAVIGSMIVLWVFDRFAGNGRRTAAV
jgi:uncharacterized membrane protein YeaQ/YmgE (transglycosylase-associated protein family)